jgi:surface antigen
LIQGGLSGGGSLERWATLAPIRQQWIEIAPFRVHQASAGRDVTDAVVIDDQTQSAHGTSRRRPEGSWKPVT